VGEFDEAVYRGFGVVLGEELEFLLEEGGAELAVGAVVVGIEEGLGLFRGELEFGEHWVEAGVGVFEFVGEGGI
jgi:hypothetical protein